MSAFVDWILEEAVSLAGSGNAWVLYLVFFVFFVLPGLASLWMRFYLLNKIEILYKERLADKDGEIKRLASSEKRLQNQLLKAKRP